MKTYFINNKYLNKEIFLTCYKLDVIHQLLNKNKNVTGCELAFLSKYTMNINKLIVTYFNLKLILKFILIQYKYDIRHIMNLNKRINWMMFTKFLSKNILQNSVILWLLVYFGTFCIYLIAPQYTFSNTLKICLLNKLLLFQSARP